MPGDISYSYPQLVAAADQLRAMSEDCLAPSQVTDQAGDEQDAAERERVRLQQSTSELGERYDTAVMQVSRTLARTAETLRAVAEDYRRTDEEVRALIEANIDKIEDLN